MNFTYQGGKLCVEGDKSKEPYHSSLRDERRCRMLPKGSR